MTRFCGNFYFNSRYCGFKTISGLRLLQPFQLRFSVKKSVCGDNTLGSIEWSASGYFASANQVFCITTHQGSLYQLTSLADVRFHIVTSMYVRFRYSGKNQMRFPVFLAYFCAVFGPSLRPPPPMQREQVCPKVRNETIPLKRLKTIYLLVLCFQTHLGNILLLY